jgi:hypothetical protein
VRDTPIIDSPNSETDTIGDEYRSFWAPMWPFGCTEDNFCSCVELDCCHSGNFEDLWKPSEYLSVVLELDETGDFDQTILLVESYRTMHRLYAEPRQMCGGKKRMREDEELGSAGIRTCLCGCCYPHHVREYCGPYCDIDHEEKEYPDLETEKFLEEVRALEEDYDYYHDIRIPRYYGVS